MLYRPKFTYIWTLGVGRFPDALRRRVSRATAVKEIARCFLASAGTTVPGELARVTGLSRPEAGLGNRALVAEGYAEMLSPGTYRIVKPRLGRGLSGAGWGRGVAAETLPEPRTSDAQVALGGPHRDSEELRGFSASASEKGTELDQLRLPRVNRRKLVERVVQIQELLAPGVDEQQILAERYAHAIRARASRIAGRGRGR